MNVNILIAISNTARTTLKPLMDDPEYNGEHLRAVQIFRRMAHRSRNEDRWNKPTIASKKRHLYSISLPSNTKNAKDSIDYLLAEYPGNVDIMGVWWWDGRQLGTSYDEEGKITGTPTYPVNEAQLLKFMPDVDGLPATVLTDVNLEQDMSPRLWT